MSNLQDQDNSSRDGDRMIYRFYLSVLCSSSCGSYHWLEVEANYFTTRIIDATDLTHFIPSELNSTRLQSVPLFTPIFILFHV